MRTVYVIGAGASNEVGLPTGYELKKEIQHLLDLRFDHGNLTSGDPRIANALSIQANSIGQDPGAFDLYLEQARHIRDALPQAISIDNFIASQRGNHILAFCAKLGIARAILQSEQNSRLFSPSRPGQTGINFNDLEDAWLLPFFQTITENCTRNELTDRLARIALVIFNYDRCVEHFLYHGLIQYYRIPPEQSAELVSQIHIYHPYGTAGTLPWQNTGARIEFGIDPTEHQLLDLTQSIRTFSESSSAENVEHAQIKQHIQWAERLVFLGFAFHQLNMTLLMPYEHTGHSATSYATTLNVSDRDKLVIARSIEQLYAPAASPSEVLMANVTCRQLFNEYWRSLSF